MGSNHARMRRGIGVVAALAAVLFAFPGAGAPAAPAFTEPQCGELDRPETGLQGDVPLPDQLSGRAALGYNCGVALVGHSNLGGRGGNTNMAWAGDCAYIASYGAGIAVVDVSDPSNPRHVQTLQGSGSSFTLETLHASVVRGRAVLVAGRYGNSPNPLPAPMEIYDVRDCERPRLVSTFTFPGNIHNLTISRDGSRVYATQPLQVVDITDLAHPRYVGNLEDDIPSSSRSGGYLGHEVMESRDGDTLYLGGQTEAFSSFTIVDITGWPARPPRILGQTEGRGHSVRLAAIDGRRYVLHSDESVVDPTAKGCVPAEGNPFVGAAQPWVSDVTDPARPRMRISQFRLAINEPANCAAQLASGVNASVHYHDVDDERRTTFAMVPMWNAGLRIVDLRDPEQPREVGYFNPGAVWGMGERPNLDKAWSHVRYDERTGHIWFASEIGGFWVVELEPQVRDALGLPPRRTSHPDGAPPRPGSDAVPLALPSTSTASYYCTFGQAAGTSGRS